VSDLYLALIHYPIINKEGRVVTTSVTNFDLHDLARTGRTFGVKTVFIVTPNEKQRDMVHYIHGYWREGYGATYNPDRSEAFQILEAVTDLKETCLTIKNRSGNDPYLIATSARVSPEALSFAEVRRRLTVSEQPILLCFGTGHGLAPEFITSCDGLLEPISGAGEFNHLPVRSAVAIILDRLVGRL